MAQLYLTTLPGPSEDLLDVGLQDLCPQTNLNDNTRRGVTVDACDLFQCGQCLKLFTSLNEFISHKSAHCQGEVNRVTYRWEGTSSDDSNSQLFCDALDGNVGTVSLTEDPVSSSLQLASNILCDNQIYKDYDNHKDGELIESSDKVTAFENIHVVSNGGLAVKLPVPGSISLTDITDNTGEVFLVNDNNNNESETICEPVSLESNISGDNNLKCNYCSKEFTKLSNLKQHIRSHTGERPYNCVLCGRKFTHVSNAKKHIASHKVWPEPWQINSKSVNRNENPSSFKAKLFSCRYCPNEFNSLSALKNHRQKIHSSQKVFKCMLSECKETFADVDSLTIHLYNHPPATFRCSLCHMKFSSFARLSQHRLSYSCQDISPSDKCSECKVENMECPLCSKVLANMDTLRRHLNTHLPQSHPCPAPNCPKYFASIRTAKSHYIHTHLPSSHIVKHQCQVCSAKFKRYDNLVRHRKVHKSALQFQCPFYKAGCTKTFSRKDVMKKHATTHLRKKNTCKTCKQILNVEKPLLEFNVLCHCAPVVKQESENEEVAENRSCDETSELTTEEGMMSSDDGETSDTEASSSIYITGIKAEQELISFPSDTTSGMDLNSFDMDYNLNMEKDINDSGLDFNLDNRVMDHFEMDSFEDTTRGMKMPQER